MRPIQEILNTLLQSFQQEGALASLPKMANAMMDSLVKRVKEMLESPQKTTAPFAQAFRTKPGIPEGLNMDDDDEQLDEYVPGSQPATPKL